MCGGGGSWDGVKGNVLSKPGGGPWVGYKMPVSCLVLITLLQQMPVERRWCCWEWVGGLGGAHDVGLLW